MFRSTASHDRRHGTTRWLAPALTAVLLLFCLVQAGPAQAHSPAPPARGASDDASSATSAPYDVISTPPRSSATSTSGTGGFTFTFDSPADPWTPAELTQLLAWTAPGSAPMNALAEVAGGPETATTINVEHDPTIGNEGLYYSGDNTLVLRDPTLSVLLHELDHAVHGAWLLRDTMWEEAMARAAEVEEMDILSQQGIVEDGYFDLHHAYSYDVFYDNTNTPDIGVANGYIEYGDTALRLLRYQEGGYAFGKMLIENPGAIRAFNAQLFTYANGDLTQQQLVSALSAAQPTVEGLPTATWVQQQQILSPSPPPGCRLVQFVSQLSANFFCRSRAGVETPQVGATVRLAVYDPDGQLLATQQQTTNSLGSVVFAVPLASTFERLRLVATGTSTSGSASSTYYRSGKSGNGIFGVVLPATTGTLTLSSPTGAFAPATTAVSGGGFSVSGLADVRGPVQADFTGTGTATGISVSRRFNKDASRYSLVLGGPTAVSRYDETTAQFGQWAESSSPIANGGTWRSSGAANSAASFTFTGSAVTWISAKGPKRGIASVAIDGVAKGTVDLYSAAATSWSRSFTGLPAAKHTIVITVSGRKNSASTGTTVVVDGFTVGGSTVQESSVQIRYDQWSGGAYSPASGGTYRVSGTAGASAQFTFTGTSVTWITTTGPAWGRARVFVDGVDEGVVDLYATTGHWQTAKTYGGLPVGNHTIVIKVLGTKDAPATSTRVVVDAFVIS